MLEKLQEIQSLLRLHQEKNKNPPLHKHTHTHTHTSTTSNKANTQLKFCKKDLESALNEKKKKLPLLFTPDVNRFTLDLLAEFFDKDKLNKLPSALLIHTSTFLPTTQLGSVSCVCKAWEGTLASDAVWKPLYVKRFHFLPPSGPGQNQNTHTQTHTHAQTQAPLGLTFKQLFRLRLLDPHIGDVVEVAWKGKFRLESLDIYQGLAWWSAIVVEKEEGGKRCVFMCKYTCVCVCLFFVRMCVCLCRKVPKMAKSSHSQHTPCYTHTHLSLPLPSQTLTLPSHTYIHTHTHTHTHTCT
jgi:hypothetical protein